LAAAQREISLLRHKLDALARGIFGVSLEALDPTQHQLLLQMPEISATPVENPPAVVVLEKRQPVRRARAPRWPEHLPIVEEVIDPPNKPSCEPPSG
jgi:transposase